MCTKVASHFHNWVDQKTTMKRWFLILAFCTLSWSRSVKRSHHSSKHSHRSRDGGGSRETFHDFMKQHPYLAANVHSVHQDFLGMIIFSLFNSRRMTNWTFHKTTKNGVLVRKWPLSPPSLSYWGRIWPWLFTCLISDLISDFLSHVRHKFHFA